MTAHGAGGAGFVVAGTDTSVGKTVLAAALAAALDACYWKPVQAGLDGPTDSETVLALSGLAADRILPEAYRLRLPASPHIAAAREGVAIEPERLALPALARPLIVECAGGLLVPLTPSLLQVEQIAAWGLPVILVARTALGTINHTLLSIEALRSRRIPLQGIAFIGDPADEVEETIVHLGQARRLGRLPHLDPLTPAGLRTAFAGGLRIGGT